MEKLKTAVFIFLFASGIISICSAAIYFFGLYLYVYANEFMEFKGEIVFLPKWIPLIGVLAFLGYTKRVKSFLLSFDEWLTEKKTFARKRLRMARFK